MREEISQREIVFGHAGRYYTPRVQISITQYRFIQTTLLEFSQPWSLSDPPAKHIGLVTILQAATLYYSPDYIECHWDCPSCHMIQISRLFLSKFFTLSLRVKYEKLTSKSVAFIIHINCQC